MAHGIPPRVNALKKCMGWFPGTKNASVYAPPVLWDAGEGEAPLVTLSSLLKGILFCLLVTFIVFYARSSRRMLPPHPRRLPIIGNLFQLSDKRWLSSRDCKERFGEYRSLGGGRMLTGSWDTRRGDVPRCRRKAHNHLQQHEIGLRIS